jgi:hypothetical protein
MLKYLDLIVVLAVLVPAFSSADTVTLPVTEDSYVFEGLPDENNGYGPLLVIGYYNSPFGGYYFSLVTFDGLSSYSGVTINDANLRLYVDGSQGVFPPNQVQIARNTTDWDEDTVTWNNKPGRSDHANIPAPSSYGWWDIDVTTYVQNWVDGTHNNYGFTITGSNGTDTTYFFPLTKECGNPNEYPELVIVYTPPATIESSSLGNIKAAFK